MPYTPLQIANTFIAKYGQGSGIDHMKLQKLVYYAHGWWLAFNETPIVTEGPQVWQYGPVFSSLYNVLSTHRMKPIINPQSPVPSIDPPLVGENTDEERLVHRWIDWVWQRYGNLSAMTLSNMTHEIGTPWQIAAAEKQYKVPRHYEIPVELIKKCFKAEAEKLNAAAS